MMKIFQFRNQSTARTVSSREYITREAVQRANDLLMGRVVYNTPYSPEDVFTRNNIQRPTSEQISAAATAAMRKFRLEQM